MRKLLQKLKRKGIVMLIAGLALLATGWTILSTKSPPDEQWAHEGRSLAAQVSLSEVVARVEQAGPEDRIAIFARHILFEDASMPAPVEGAETKADPKDSRFVLARMNPAGLLLTPELLGETQASISHVGELPNPAAELFSVLLDLLPLILICGLIYFVYGRQFLQGRSHEVLSPEAIGQGLDDVAGIDNVRDEVREIIEILRNPDAVAGLGGRAPKGLLLSGPPGTGKTLLARAIAKEAGVSFMSVDATTLNQVFMGMGSLKVRQAFSVARKHSPCIVFIDEIDALGSRGDASGSEVSNEKGNTINALLVELDGIKQDGSIFLIGATNLPDRLDSALTRPGRIDRKVHLTLPDKDGRASILRVHAAKLPLAEDVNLEDVAGTTPSFSGADLANLCNEAALCAARRGRHVVTTGDFAMARDRMLLGQTGSEIKLHEDERETTAVHEAGHAVAAWLIPGSDRIEKVTILPHGPALGFVLQVPERDRRMETKARLLGRMVVLAAGRAAESLIFGEENITTGAEADIAELTRIASGMVTRWGMGSTGFVNLAQVPGLLETSKVQAEIRLIANDAARQSSELLQSNRDLLDALAAALLERDVMSGAEVDQLLQEAVAARAVQEGAVFAAE